MAKSIICEYKTNNYDNASNYYLHIYMLRYLQRKEGLVNNALFYFRRLGWKKLSKKSFNCYEVMVFVHR